MKLLLAEDEKSLAKAITTILEKNNYSVDTVYDGNEALACLEYGSYDMVIMDIMMPKTDGITALKQLRAAGNQVPVLLLTAKSEIDDKVLGLDSGANDYLTKPFDFKELLARIRALTRTTATCSADGNLLQLGNISLNRSTFELSAPGGSFRLANKEYQMLELLLKNPKHLVSSEHFLVQIWGYDTDAEINVIWVYISYIRKKLSAINANVEIKASRNSGYYLQVNE